MRALLCPPKVMTGVGVDGESSSECKWKMNATMTLKFATIRDTEAYNVVSSARGLNIDTEPQL